MHHPDYKCSTCKGGTFKNRTWISDRKVLCGRMEKKKTHHYNTNSFCASFKIKKCTTWYDIMRKIDKIPRVSVSHT